MKKAQMYSQIFIYVLTVLMISFVLIYGYTTIKNFKGRAEQVSCLKLKNDLTNTVSSLMSDFGTVKKKTIKACGNYHKICFAESYYSIDPENLPTNDPIIRDSILDNTGMNVFLVDRSAKEQFNIGPISVEPDVICLETTGNSIDLRLEGKGNFVLLDSWN